MVQAITAPTLAKRRKKDDGSSSTIPKRFCRLRTCFVILIGATSLFLLRMESIVYRELRDRNQQDEEDSIVAKALRYGTLKNPKNSDSSEQNLTPVSRNGFLSKGSLRSPIVASPEQTIRSGKLTFDYLEVELRRMKHQETQQKEILVSSDRNPLPRTIALNEDMGVEELAEILKPYPSKKEKTMVLEEETIQTDNKYDGESLLEFERPFFNDCDRVLKSFPTVHPTCNSIHELSLSTSKTDSTLLSMKGSWRSVWKFDLDRENKEPKLTNAKEFEKNETSSSIHSNATAESDQDMQASSSASVVLKMLHLHRQFDRHSYDAHYTDIIVMDLLTASPYVVDAYGYCGQTVVTEFASATGRDYVKRYDIKSRDRLRIARDLARGLADVQALQPLPHGKLIANGTKNGAYDETPSIPVVFAHNDINIANTVMVNGRIKWNDFNIGVFMRKRKNKPDTLFDSSKGRHHRPPGGKNNPKKSEEKIAHESKFSPSNFSSSFTAFTDRNRDKDGNLCPAPVKYRSDMWRSPEEIKNISYVQVTQSDMYGLANILYQTMTRHQPWTYKEPGGALTKDDIANRKLKGTIPTIPEQYLNTTKRELQTLFAATNMCFFPDPEKRPTARRLAFGLGSLYEKLKHKERVSRQSILNYLLPLGA